MILTKFGMEVHDIILEFCTKCHPPSSKTLQVTSNLQIQK